MARASPSIFPSPRLHANPFNSVPENEAACNLNNPGRDLLSGKSL